MPHFPQTPFDAPRKSYRDSAAMKRSSVMRDGTSAWPLGFHDRPAIREGDVLATMQYPDGSREVIHPRDFERPRVGLVERLLSWGRRL